MTAVTPSVRDRLTVPVETIRTHAAEVDRDARFPHESIAALREAGLLGLGLPERLGGPGGSAAEIARAITDVAATCGSTAMVYTMHVVAARTLLATTAEDEGPKADALRAIAAGEHLTTIAFSERGSRSHFWAQISRAVPDGAGVVIDADKSWVTAAAEADSYVAAVGAPGTADPLATELYLLDSRVGRHRGRGSLRRARHAWQRLLPGPLPRRPRIRRAAARRAGRRLHGHARGHAALVRARLRRLLRRPRRRGRWSSRPRTPPRRGSSTRVRRWPICRPFAPGSARRRCGTSRLAPTSRRPRAASTTATRPCQLSILGLKAACAEMAIEVTDAAMRVCGGAAYSRHLPLELVFRDARAAAVMAPTTDILVDLLGKSLTGRPLF